MGLSYSLYNTVPTDDSAAPMIEGTTVPAQAGTYYSRPWSCEEGAWSLHVETTGALTGTWTLWASNKKHPDPADDDDWVDISAHTAYVETNPAGAATKWMATPDHLSGAWFRHKFVWSAGSGVIYSWVTTQGL